MIATLGTVLAASVLGSPHCAAMCGGFVCFYAGEARRVGPGAHAAYHLSRLGAYATLGALAGAAGAGVERIGAWGGVNRAAAIVSGALLLAWGIALIAQAFGARVPVDLAPRGFHAAIGRLLRRLREQPPGVRAAAIGGLSGLLPCGWLYAWVAVAGGTGSPLAGTLVMLAFWLGTVPMLAGLGVAARGAIGPIARRLPVVTGLLLVVFGALTLAGKLVPSRAMHDGLHGMNAGAPASHATLPASPGGDDHGRR